MLIWLVTIGEPLPTDGTNDRLHRTGMLSKLLIKRGHDVIWWSSTFDHVRKKHRFNKDTIIDINDHFKIYLLHSIKYKKNISISRIVNHYDIARQFARQSLSAPQPSIILCSFPTIELSATAIEYGKKRGVPVIIDVRDLWPDIFCEFLPESLKSLGEIALYPLIKKTGDVFEQCQSIIGISDSYLKWGLSYSGRARGKYDEIFPLGYKKPVSTSEDMEISHDSMTELGIDPSKIICWFIGTFGKTYDLRIVLEAARNFKKLVRRDVQFVFSGYGEKYQEWFEMSKGLDNVVFTGWLNSDQISYLMKIADIGLAAYASRAPQGLPNKFFEYMCAGLPILSNLHGEAACFLSDNKCGFTYESENIDDFVSKLMYLVSNEDLRNKTGKRGKAVFEKSYSSDIIYSRMVDYLVDIAGMHSSTRQYKRSLSYENELNGSYVNKS